MKGKAIYTPSGKAGEYSYWAVNFYNGCSADCDYCYCKKGVMAHLWSNKPTLKKSLVNPIKAMEIFKKEVSNNVHALKEHGLFFNFTSDPFLKETIDLNYDAMQFCNGMGIPVKALTKQTWWIDKYDIPDNVTIGFTLTGFDNMEAGAAPTIDRIKAMEELRGEGYKIWASIEPVIDIAKSIEIISECHYFAHHLKIGPLAGKSFNQRDIIYFIQKIDSMIHADTTLYWKEGFIEKLGIDRNTLSENCVNRDYKWW